MRKILKTVASLAVVMFTGCTSELTNDAVSPLGGTTTLRIGIEETKTCLGSEGVDGVRKVYWSEGDKVVLNGEISTEVEFNETMTSATFTFGAVLDHPYSVLYPASAYVDAETIKLPAIQEYAEDTFATNCAPMASYAESANDNIKLHHLAAVVRLQVKLPSESEHATHNLARVEFRGKKGEQVSGNFAIDYAEATLTATSTDKVDQVVTTKVGKALSTEVTDIYVVVPAGEYTEGFTVRLYDDAYHFMDISTNAITLVKGDIKKMPAFDFVPTGTVANLEIATADEWNAFAKDYNAGIYNAVDEFTFKIVGDLDFAGKSLEEVSSFKHILDGGDHTIKNWTNSNNAVVGKLLEGGIVKKLKIDSSSSFKFTTYWYNDGVFVRENYGTLINCINAANITIVDAERSHAFYIGALVGRNYSTGLIEACTNNGALAIDSGVKFGSNKFCFGGIVGHNQGEVKNSTNNGALTAAGDNGTQTANYIGGIAGENDNGTVLGCTNGTTAALATTLKANRNIVGGIVGWNNGTCNQNTNEATFDCSPSEYANNYPWAMAGGIVGGIAGGTVNNNTNKGSISVNTNLAGNNSHIGVGGIAGTLDSDNFELKNNDVTSAVTLSTSTTVSRAGVGGLIGNAFNNKSTLDFTGDTGKIECKIAGGSGTGASFGGVVGIAYDAIKIKNVTNCACVITLTANATNVAAGGIIGRIGDTNGSGELSDCIYKGDITVTDAGNKQTRTGGIVGITVKGIKISGCKYYGNITFVNSTVPKAGGLIGYENAASTISKCSYGGVINGNTVDTDELALKYFTGNKKSSPAAADITYWDGK